MTERKLDLTICRPTGWHLESPRIGAFMLRLGHYMGRHEPRVAIHDANMSTSRILMIHNWGIAQARRNGSSHILFLDPDMDPHPQWWEWAWEFSKTHACAVVAGPYRGYSPDGPERYPVQVWVKSGEGEPTRLDNASAQSLRGVWEVEAIGSGLLLVDLALFDLLDKQRGADGGQLPYFDDTFADSGKTHTGYTQDGWFCARVRAAKAQIYANFDFWADHQQFGFVGRPGRRTTPGEHRCLGEPCTETPTEALSDEGEGPFLFRADTCGNQ